MTKLRLVKIAASVAASLGLMASVVGIAGASATNDTTGPSSENKNISHVSSTTKVKNTNKFHINNENDQSAYSGNAAVKHNTTGGDATTGVATNNNGLSATVTVDNSAGAGGSNVKAAEVSTTPGDATNSNTGPDSTNLNISKSTTKTTVTNTNKLTINNENEQHASSGNAKVSGNTTGGNATSGNASNTSTTSVDVSITN